MAKYRGMNSTAHAPFHILHFAYSLALVFSSA